MDKVTDVRSVTSLKLSFSKDPLDTTDNGHQSPVDESLMTEFDPEEAIVKGDD